MEEMGWLAAPALREVPNEAVHTFLVDAQGQHGWLIAYPGRGLIEKYLRGDLYLAFRRRSHAPASDTPDDGFVIQAVQQWDHSEIHGHFAGKWHHAEKPLMLPHIVQNGDMREDVIPTRIGFCSFHGGDFSASEGVFVFEPLHGTKKVSGGTLGDDWEIVCASRDYVVARNYGGKHEIQRASKGIDNCPDIANDYGVNWLVEISNDQFHIGRIRVHLRDKSVWVSIAPEAEAAFQNWDLGIGPLDWD